MCCMQTTPEYLRQMKSKSEAIEKVIGWLKETDIDGCITGSSLTGQDFDQWKSHPDIDIFCYSAASQVHALDVLHYEFMLNPGKEDPRADKGERWKRDRIMATRGNRTEQKLSTVSYTDPARTVVVNVSRKPYQEKAMDVIANFDMSIVMVAHDIPTGMELDLRTLKSPDVMTAVPNPLRRVDGTLWNTSHWLRQWDRVIKYWDRGFDTRPMARFYKQLLADTIEQGSMFQTDKANAAYDAFIEEFKMVGEKIDIWLEDKED